MRQVLAALVLACPLAAAADPMFSVTAGTAVDLAATPLYSGPIFGTVTIGNLVLSEAGEITYTYVGSEAQFMNRIFQVGALNYVTPSTGPEFVPGASDSARGPFATAAGFVPFTFQSPLGSVANGMNNGDNEPNFGVMIDANGLGATLFFNDSGAGPDRDFDDMIVRAAVRGVVVPEPSTYALMAVGLGIMGFIGRRRRTV